MARLGAEDPHPAGKDNSVPSTNYSDSFAADAERCGWFSIELRTGYGHGDQNQDPFQARAGAAQTPQGKGRHARPDGARMPPRYARGRSAMKSRTRVENEGGFVLGCYSDPLGKKPLILAVLPIDAVEPTPFQRDLSADAPQAARRRARPHRHVPRSDHRRDRAGEGLLDAERPPSPGGDAAPRREGDHRARGAQARDRVADPRAQHREGAQPARQVARGDPHLPQPDRGGHAEEREGRSRTTWRSRRS